MMTYGEAEALYEPETNVRWIACHAAMGHRPATWEFTSWNTRKWAEFLKAYGIDNRRNDSPPIVFSMAKGISVDAAQQAYNEWLKEHLS